MAFNQHNLGTVVGFEFMRTIKKKGFVVATLAIPVVLVVVFALIFASNSSTEASADAQKNSTIAFTYTDASGLIPPQMAQAAGGKSAGDPDAALAAVKDGSSEAYFAYPKDPAAEPVKVYGSDMGVFENGKYEAVAKQLLTAAAQAQVNNPQLAAALAGGVAFESETYRDGKASGGMGSVIPPMLFLVVFYISMILLSNQMLNSTLEEKENRVTEMILTTLNPTTLITGKIISLFAVGLVQMLVFLTPIAAGYLFLRDSLALPDLDLSILVFEPVPLIVGALLLLGGFTLFTGVLVAIGAAGHPAYRYSRWVLFGGLAAVTVLSFGTLFTFARFVPAPMKDDSFAGVFEGMLAIESLLVLLGVVFLEVVHVAVTRTIKDAQDRLDRAAAGSGIQ